VNGRPAASTNASICSACPPGSYSNATGGTHTITIFTNWFFNSTGQLCVWFETQGLSIVRRIRQVSSASPAGKPHCVSADGIATHSTCSKPNALPVLARQAPLSACCVAPDPTPTHPVRVLQRKINVVHELEKFRNPLSKR
jgi:hypothetical protein